MSEHTWPFPVMHADVVGSDDALEMALRAYEERDERWLPITAELADDLLNEGDAARTALGVSAIPRTRRWDANSLCCCVLPADKRAWRGHGLLRIMSLVEFEAWCSEWTGGLTQEME